MCGRWRFRHPDSGGTCKNHDVGKELVDDREAWAPGLLHVAADGGSTPTSADEAGVYHWPSIRGCRHAPCLRARRPLRHAPQLQPRHLRGSPAAPRPPRSRGGEHAVGRRRQPPRRDVGHKRPRNTNRQDKIDVALVSRFHRSAALSKKTGDGRVWFGCPAAELVPSENKVQCPQTRRCQSSETDADRGIFKFFSPGIIHVPCAGRTTCPGGLQAVQDTGDVKAKISLKAGQELVLAHDETIKV